ncbi:acyl-CoA N-acyltransferase [Entophlyctis helioformis]|nr:acyl-CoA N-acyltransferase [Entophlyctis helioformis]
MNNIHWTHVLSVAASCVSHRDRRASRCTDQAACSGFTPDRGPVHFALIPPHPSIHRPIQLGLSGMIRPVRPEDAEAIAAIYNPYVRTTTISLEDEPMPVVDMAARIQSIVAAHFPFLVWEEDGKVVAYAYASSFRPRAGYRFTAESSVYVDAACQARGIGSRLYVALLDELRSRGFHSVVGVATTPNDKSERLHERLGFTKAAVMRQAGWKFGQWWDVLMWQKAL